MSHPPYRPSPGFLTILGAFFGLTLFFLSTPHLAVELAEVPHELPPFPVTVDPRTKTIGESGPVSLFGTPLLAAAGVAVADGTTLLAAAILENPVYEELNPFPEPVAVRLEPGMRKEQVANVLSSALSWTAEERRIFLSEISADEEGRLYPSLYLFPEDTTPVEAAAVIHTRFAERVGARYASSTEERVPFADALTIASIIEREAGDESEMPVIAGILWNRLFVGMKLQADSTLSYARGTARNGWWPVPRPRDKYLKSPYNTYQNEGLPPAPIASPSVAALYATLNPTRTECLFFFHSRGDFYCSKTYEEHVAKLKKIYGRGR